MGFRFYKRINILPGISMNLSKSGPSFSFGPKGMKTTISSKSVRTSFGIPGTGIYYTTSRSIKSGSNSNSPYHNHQGPIAAQTVPNLGLLKGLFLSEQEKSFHMGLKAFLGSRNDEAYNIFAQNAGNSDSAFMAGYIALGKGLYSMAEYHLSICRQKLQELGRTMAKFNGDFELTLEITEYIQAPVNLDYRGLGLALVEAYQGQDKYNEAVTILSELWNQNPSDKVVCLSLIDLITHHEPFVQQHLKDIIEATKDLDNDEPIDTNILYLRGFSLYAVGLVDAGLMQFNDILRKKKDRPEKLLLQIRYIKGRILEDTGQKSKAKTEYQKVYMESPDFQDVKVRLGL